MKVLVTGASGFIGNHVVQELLKGGVEVIATSRSRENAGGYSWLEKVCYVAFDFSSFDNTIDYFSFFHHPDAVIHLAWEGLPNYKSDFHIEKNLPGHLAFISNLVRNGCKDITITGTCFEYGMQEGELEETMAPHPENCYSIAKDKLRQQLEVLQQQCDFSLKWVRLFYMYGQGQSAGSILPLLQKAIDNGEASFNMSPGDQLRDYLPVETVAAYICRITLQGHTTGIINCCSGEPQTVKRLVENYLTATQQAIQLNTGFYPYSDMEPFAFWGNTKKLKQIIR